MNAVRCFALSVLSFATLSTTALPAQQQQAWGPSQQSMYHNHPGGAPSYSGYGAPTGTSTIAPTQVPSYGAPATTVPAARTGRSKRVSTHTGAKASTVKSRRSE